MFCLVDNCAKNLSVYLQEKTAGGKCSCLWVIGWLWDFNVWHQLQSKLHTPAFNT
jgi:hypothetical protein